MLFASTSPFFLSRCSSVSSPVSGDPEIPTQEARNRAFMSYLPREVGDGLGHRLVMVNYELHLALMLDVAYVHRGSTYGSLTREKESAIDDGGHCSITA